MLGKTYPGQNCSAARSLEEVGERWSLLILRDAIFAGMTRFSEFERDLGIAPNVLSSRLESFVENGLMEVRTAPGRAGAREYVLTEKGRDLAGVVRALIEWGDRWLAPDGPPVLALHQGCGGQIHSRPVCDRCGAEPGPDEVQAVPGPGA